MTQEIKFPTNPFEDVNPSEFNKLNKKHVTEDFVEENLKLINWEVYKPFNDTGIDRIITKRVCPKGHTNVNENLKNKCPVCKEDSIPIIRFIQVKTRQLKDNVFGFTLKSKDIRVDPRHIYLLYSDNTSEDKQDFLILSVKDYLKFFSDSNLKSPFAPTSFRKGNNKLNSLKYNSDTNKWKWGKYDWEMFRNLDGMKKIQNPQIDINLNTEIKETRKLADKLQRMFSRGSSYSEDAETDINTELTEKLATYKDNKKIIQLRKKVEDHLNTKCDAVTIGSMKKYFEFIKTLDATGGDEDSKETKELLKEMEEKE